MSITDKVVAFGTSIADYAKSKPMAASGIAIGATGAAVLATTAIVKRKKRKSKSYSKARKSKSRSKKRSKSRKARYARTAGKRKDRSHKRIRMTKSGQPYIILKSGKARFISKKSARLSRKRKGGRY